MSQFVYPLFIWWAFGLFPVWGNISPMPTGPDVNLSVEGSGGTSRIYRHLFQVPCPSFHPAPHAQDTHWHSGVLCYSQPLKFPSNCCGLTAGFPRCSATFCLPNNTLIPQTRWLQPENFIPHTSAGWKVQDQIANQLGPWWELSSWSVDGHHLVVSLQEKEKASSLTSLTL